MSPLTDPTLLLLLLLLPTSPADADAPLNWKCATGLRPSLQILFLNLELLDPRESNYFLAIDKDFPSDMACLSRRFTELSNTPYLTDSSRFPTYSAIEESLQFNRDYRDHLLACQSLDSPLNSWKYDKPLADAEALYHIWDLARDATYPFYYLSIRRRALGELRDLLGPDAFNAGALPPHIPLHHFTRIP